MSGRFLRSSKHVSGTEAVYKIKTDMATYNMSMSGVQFANVRIIFNTGLSANVTCAFCSLTSVTFTFSNKCSALQRFVRLVSSVFRW